MKIEIKDLYKEIKKNVILDNVNITLTGGKIYGIQEKTDVERRCSCAV